MVQDDGFTLVTRKKPNVKWAPLAKRDVERLVHGPKTNGAGPSDGSNNAGSPTVGLVADLGPIRPNDKADGPNLGADGGCTAARGPGPVLLAKVTGPTGAAVGSGPADLHSSLLRKSGPINSGPFYNAAGINIYGPKKDHGLSENKAQRKGSGYFDVSQNNFGSRQSPILETKNTFGKLQDEEDCFDTEHGLWEKEMLMVRKYYETNTHPPDDAFSSWSEKLKAYYVMLTKFDPVESESDEAARDIAHGVWSLVSRRGQMLFVCNLVLSIVNKRFARGIPSFPKKIVFDNQISRYMRAILNNLKLRCCLFFLLENLFCCRPHLQASAGEEVDQMSSVCKEKRVCFFFYIKPLLLLLGFNTHHTDNLHLHSLSTLSLLSLYNLHHRHHHHRHHFTTAIITTTVTTSTAIITTTEPATNRTKRPSPPPPSHLAGVAEHEVVAEWRWSRGDGGVEAGVEVVMMMMMAEQWWWWWWSSGGGGGVEVVVAEHGWRWRWWWRSGGGGGGAWVEVEVVPRRGKALLEEALVLSLPHEEVGERQEALLKKKKNKHSFEPKHLPASARCRQKRQEALFEKKTNTTLVQNIYKNQLCAQEIDSK
ncbi:hypothetical protein Hanom_Chr12g01107501 [Helianthus anomalus]